MFPIYLYLYYPGGGPKNQRMQRSGLLREYYLSIYCSPPLINSYCWIADLPELNEFCPLNIFQNFFLIFSAAFRRVEDLLCSW